MADTERPTPAAAHSAPSFWSSLRGRLAAACAALFLVTSLLVAVSAYTSQLLEDAMHEVTYLARGRQVAMNTLFLSTWMFDVPADQREEVAQELRRVMHASDERLRVLRYGSAELGIPAAGSSNEVVTIERRQERWRVEVVPRLERLLAIGDRAAALPVLTELVPVLRAHGDEANQLAEARERSAAELARRLVWAEVAAFAVALLVLGLVLRLVWSVAGRVRALAGTSERIAQGALTERAPEQGGDELAALGRSFNEMTGMLRRTIDAESAGRARLEELLATIRESTASLTSATAEILAGASQQASGAQEQAAAVSQTVTTVDEVLATSDQAVRRAQALGTTSERSLESGRTGRRVVEETVSSMGMVKEQVETLAANILSLAEQAQAIGEITATVNDLADQTNLLALNAGIEASRAGEHGRGFAVVAAEIKALADQSKKSTTQVRRILGDIQRATHSAVLATEQGTRSVNSAIGVVRGADDAIRMLLETLAEAHQVATQISASANQQVAGMHQIHQAMRDVNQATTQGMASTRQTERAARDLNLLGERLNALLASSRTP